MDFFDRHKALIITSLLFLLLMLSLYNFNLSNNNEKTREMLIDLESFKTEQAEEKKPEEIEPAKIPQKNTVKTHQAYNENQESRDANFSKQLDEIFQKNSASQQETSDNESTSGSGNFTTQNSPKKKEVKKRSDGNQTTENTSAKNGGLDNSSISFSLKGRSAVDIPNPIYTCDLPGRVVVNITVNEGGRVIATAINKASSTSNNECLTQQALQYASQAVFSKLAGRTAQPGTITYQFKP
ncbi:TonB family C-terminal domain-containing protein [Gillisia sp. Hel1_33_143]|uniref:energy transducer TonB family protein n=1 Tax=Gillisia sp. Hel1_33_143 TaxID=1336796 RepID=UPI00087DE1A9|nr:energy transducer TonB [Gillisia sp. Hel1_33_143]SDR95703.1 TonB family C-terminal domain-containing protein [Gillisia sp. Hel1_33_143]